MNLIALAVACTCLALGISAVADEPTNVVATTYYRTFTHAHPVLKEIKPGQLVATKTIDSAGLDEKDQKRSEPSNPLTGPFSVEGAEPGDALVVRLKKVRLNRDWGWSAFRLGLFSLTPETVEHIYPNDIHPDLVVFVVDLAKGAKLTGPRVETADEIISIGSQPEFASALDNGLKMATSDMAAWLAKDYGMEPWAAHLLIGYQGRYNVVTVAGSMALCIPKNRLPK
jgi:acetamidase/formamidase